MTVADNDGDGDGEESMPKIIRKKMSLKELTLSNSDCSILAVLILSPLPLSISVNSFKCFLDHESGVSSGSGHLDVERAR